MDKNRSDRVIQGWGQIDLGDLFYAYRKAKADCFIERSITIAEAFSRYESMLPGNLKALRDRIHTQDMASLLLETINQNLHKVIAKKLATETHPTVENASKSRVNGAHRFYSDPNRAFKSLCNTHQLSPDFRLVGDFSVEMHILSALWINLVGHKFDAALSDSAYGSRLRRYRAEGCVTEKKPGVYQIETIGSFLHYIGPYRAWRQNGMKVIRAELEADRQVIAVSMDLTSFYHKVDPGFMVNPAFLDDAGIELTPWEKAFTEAFKAALTAWSEKTKSLLIEMGANEESIEVGGLPIGLSISRVLANTLLTGLDRDIEQGVVPLYYGRYVDDILLVLRDPDTIANEKDLLVYLAKRTAWFPSPSDDQDKTYLTIPADYRGLTKLLLQPEKQRLFFLQGQGGLDLLDSIEEQMRSISSERRMMPDPDGLERMASAGILSTAGQAAEETGLLHNAEGLSVRRLGWSVQLRAVETLAHDLKPQEWEEERARFYAFARNHILRADRILEQLDYLPRLLSLAVSLGDWKEAKCLFESTTQAIAELRHASAAPSVKVNGQTIDGSPSNIWDMLGVTLRKTATEAFYSSMSIHDTEESIPDLALELHQMVNPGWLAQSVFSDLPGLQELPSQSEYIKYNVRRLCECDLARVPYKEHVRKNSLHKPSHINGEDELLSHYRYEDDLTDFLRTTTNYRIGQSDSPAMSESSEPNGNNASLIPYLCPTRPYTHQEIALLLPKECVYSDDALKNWARYVRAVRGVWVAESDSKEIQKLVEQPEKYGQNDSPQAINIGINRPNPKVMLGISSLLSEVQSFRGAASRIPDISKRRYQRIERIVNLAIDTVPRPTHLLLPELSLPERWIKTVAGRLQAAGISLIAGLDYQHMQPDQIYSEALLVLADDRLGYPSSIQIRQRKSLPAVDEEHDLLHKYGRRWTKSEIDEKGNPKPKPIYNHQGFCFGVLVCSELQNIIHRQHFQGNVDCLMVLSWNRDLETFSTLLESATLDVHAHLALVNNRKYGDSRVRTPAKEKYARDRCRVRGGENEQLVVVELEIEPLRAFQSRDKRWTIEEDPYKPLPEGYRIAPYRRVTAR